MAQTVLTPQRGDANVIDRIAEKVRSMDLSSDPSWGSLDALSSKTVFEGLEVDPEGIIVLPDGTFSGVMNVYVLLQYDPGSRDSFSDSASFLAAYEGHIGDDGDPSIDHISVNTDPFYEEEVESESA